MYPVAKIYDYISVYITILITLSEIKHNINHVTEHEICSTPSVLFSLR